MFLGEILSLVLCASPSPWQRPVTFLQLVPPQPPQCSSVPCSSGWQKGDYCHVAFKLEIVLMLELFWKVTLKAIKHQVTLLLMFSSSEFLSGKLKAFYELVIVLFHRPR